MVSVSSHEVGQKTSLTPKRWKLVISILPSISVMVLVPVHVLTFVFRRSPRWLRVYFQGFLFSLYILGFPCAIGLALFHAEQYQTPSVGDELDQILGIVDILGFYFGLFVAWVFDLLLSLGEALQIGCAYSCTKA
jgi:hypothetical protein